MEVYKIVTLKDPVTGEKLIPRIPQGIQYEVVGDEITPPIDLTLDANTLNGHPLTDFLLKSDNIDADTLGGKPASDYALKSEAGASYTKGDTAEPPETLQAGSFYETSDGYLYIGNSENQPVEVLTLAHELNIGTINSMTVEAILNMMKEKGIGETASGTTTDYSDIITGKIALGATVTMGGHQWIVCHTDYNGGIFYLLDAVVEETCQFGSNINYSGSTLASKATAFESSLPSNVKDKLLTVNVSGVSAKVFVPTKDQYQGGFDLFSADESDDTSRMGYLNGAATSVWTSSPYSSSSVWSIDVGGRFNYNTQPNSTHGFRPAVCLAL